MELESDTFDEIAEVISTTNDVGARNRGCTPESYSPSVSVVWVACGSFFWSQEPRCVAIDNWTIYCESLQYG